MDRGYAPAELLIAADLTRPMLAYWSTTGLLVGSAPDGHYTAGSVLAAIRDRLTGEPAGWPDAIYVTARGLVLDTDTEPAAWLLHPRRQLTHAAPAVMLALAS